jgi:MFS family permease
MTAQTPNIHRWRAFSLLAVAAFMTVMDLTIVNTALPTIGRELHFSQTSLLWVVTAYELAYGGFLLLGGRAADLLGRRRVIIAGLAVFTAASLGASLAGSETVLIAMRATQGLGAAMFLPAALSTVRNMRDARGSIHMRAIPALMIASASTMASTWPSLRRRPDRIGLDRLIL